MLQQLPCDLLLKVLHFRIQSISTFEDIIELRCLSHKIGIHVQYFLNAIQKDPFGWMLEHQCDDLLKYSLRKILTCKELMADFRPLMKNLYLFIIKWNGLHYPLTSTTLSILLKNYHNNKCSWFVDVLIHSIFCYTLENNQDSLFCFVLRIYEYIYRYSKILPNHTSLPRSICLNSVFSKTMLQNKHNLNLSKHCLSSNTHISNTEYNESHQQKKHKQHKNICLSKVRKQIQNHNTLHKILVWTSISLPYSVYPG
jgi:hypothetical protein